MDYIKEIAEAMSANHAAVMVGAGFSKNADKISVTDKWFKNWNELADMFYDTVYGKCESKKAYTNSLRLAQEVEVTVGRPKLEKILKEAVPDEDYGPSDIYIKLMELPWRDVFTTNYDTLLERAADKVSKRRYNVVVNQEDLVNSNDAPRILKLHGSFPSHRPFIITEEDYRTYPIKFAAMVNTVQQALLENVFCMIGFSCEDPNFLSWIGWIHDNLGKSSAQKIYMVSVEHISEAKQKLLFEKNIIVVDLQELYPKENISERLIRFLDRLSELTEEKAKQNQWFDLSEISLSSENSYEEITNKLKILNESYPGWIFLPWKMKYKVNYILNEVDEDIFSKEKEEFENISIDMQIEYMYQYVKFLNIVGRPIIVRTVEKIWNILEIYKNSEERLEYKLQYIYLQLLRTFRELANWEKYDLCREKVRDSILAYEEKQFLFACDWWMTMYRFQDGNLVERLNKWKLTQGDLYWPMVKSCMYAIAGEIAAGEQLLSEILPQIRHQLVKNSRDEYLCSIEESVVSLLNFIRQGNWNDDQDVELEGCIQTSKISWWEENDKYCLYLNEDEEIKHSFAVRTNYDLSITYTSYWGKNNKKTYYALDYLRFLEQTAHPFRIQFVTNTKGLKNVVNLLHLAYPHWCLVQMLVAQDDKNLDILYGRNRLSGMTQLEVDKCTQVYLNALELVCENVKSEKVYWAKSFYDHSAKILPKIISRLCYKCSVDMLDQILEQMLGLCGRNIQDSLEDINEILKGVCYAYTEKEQGERIEKILRFPIKTNARRTYYDPVNYLKSPREKYKISDELYHNIIIQIRQLLENGTVQEKTDALRRLSILAQTIYMQQEDEEYLYRHLEEKHTCESQSVLYHINRERYKMNDDIIMKKTLQLLENDCNKQCFSAHIEPYREFIEILPDIQLNAIDYVKFFSAMAKVIQTNIHWMKKQRAAFQVEQRTIQIYRIAIGLLLLKMKDKTVNVLPEEKEAIMECFKELQEYYLSANVLDFIEKELLGIIEQKDEKSKQDIYSSTEEKLWLYSNEDFKLLKIFYLECKRMKINIDKVEQIANFSKLLYQAVVYKIINTEINNLRPALQLLYALVVNNIVSDRENKVLLINLPKLMKSTTIKMEDLEDEALHKLNCRRDICEIASEYYKRGEKNSNILQWKEITKNSDEFVEIRNVEFD